MKRTPRREKRNFAQNALAIVEQAIGGKLGRSAPVTLEDAWAEWSKLNVAPDDLATLRLRAAFEAGAKAAKEMGSRIAGLKGGKARAAALSKKRRAEIAKKAASARWNRPSA